jgi:type II secretory pathway pseudopilin PulG
MIYASQARATGFTLAETSVIVVIVGVVAAIAGPSFIRWYQSKQLDNALARLESALRESQSEAIRRSQACTVDIPRGVHQTISGTCLITGDRPLPNIKAENSRLEDPWRVAFDFKGQTLGPQNSGTIILSVPGSTLSPHCLVIAGGIGLMRTGKYDANGSPPCQTP